MLTDPDTPESIVRVDQGVERASSRTAFKTPRVLRWFVKLSFFDPLVFFFSAGIERSRSRWFSFDDSNI